ncbi:MAG: hypothetical protein WC978_00205 [bacterium]
MENEGWTDRRVNDIRETAISIIRMAEKSANGNGGAGLLYSFYVEEAPWCSFNPVEQKIISTTVKAFRRELVTAGFLPKESENKEPQNA